MRVSINRKLLLIRDARFVRMLLKLEKKLEKRRRRREKNEHPKSRF